MSRHQPRSDGPCARCVETTRRCPAIPHLVWRHINRGSRDRMLDVSTHQPSVPRTARSLRDPSNHGFGDPTLDVPRHQPCRDGNERGSCGDPIHGQRVTVRVIRESSRRVANRDAKVRGRNRGSFRCDLAVRRPVVRPPGRGRRPPPPSSGRPGRPATSMEFRSPSPVNRP